MPAWCRFCLQTVATAALVFAATRYCTPPPRPVDAQFADLEWQVPHLQRTLDQLTIDNHRMVRQMDECLRLLRNPPPFPPLVPPAEDEAPPAAPPPPTLDEL